MIRINRRVHLLLSKMPKMPLYLTIRRKYMKSKNIRQEYINFFKNNHDHMFLKSSPVVPFCDPSVPFVNAGMNQFKGIFLGKTKPPYKRVVNSQKCIRVGGKHNDLENVGNDGHHHTFFEMLGNWSFGDYFKEKACKMAWELLTGEFKLNPSQLYVTYFKGDEEMGIEPDEETKNIWLSIGIPQEHVLPFGARENFWEMGFSGPCGPCTEIHYDHVHSRRDASFMVNQGFDDVVEVWNLVFIQYNRGPDGSLSKLPNVHVDTGMGLERLVAVLQGKLSNYETDLFLPLFNSIQKVSGAPAYKSSQEEIDVNYRILADHCRMVTIALTDGMFPDQNFKLRRVLRRAFNIAENTFHCEKGLVSELTYHVADTLVDAYPEVGAKLKQIQLIINQEEETLKSLKKSVFREWKTLIESNMDLKELSVEVMPGLVAAFKELQTVSLNIKNDGMIPIDLPFKLYETYGLDKKTMKILCDHFEMQIDFTHFENHLQNIKRQSRESHNFDGSGNDVDESIVKYAAEKNLLPTDDSFKYKYYKKDDYVFPALKCQIEAIVHNKQCLPEILGCMCDIVLDRTNLYHEAGGQESDAGLLVFKNEIPIVVNKVTNVQGHLLHNVNVPEDFKLSVGDSVLLKIVSEKRLGCMRNHTATHLVNAALHSILTVTCQKSSQVSEFSLTFEFAVYGEKFGVEQIKKIEELVQSAVAAAVPVRREAVDAQKLQEFYIANEITLVPGEVYPQNDIHIIEITDKILISREACCGTHLLNTADVGAFCITTLNSSSAGTKCLTAVTGRKAEEAIKNGNSILEKVSLLKHLINCLMENKKASFEEVQSAEQQIKNMKKHLMSPDKHTFPYVVRSTCLEDLENMSKMLKHFERKFFRKNLETEMQMILRNMNQPYIVHYLKCSSSIDDVPLQKATKMCPNLPVLLIASSRDTLKARCCVPKNFVCQDFNAKLWIEKILSILKAEGFAPRGQNSDEVFNMKKKHVKVEQKSILIEEAIASAKKFADKKVQKM